MRWKDVDREILREVANTGRFYGKKIESSLYKIKRLKKAIAYLHSRMKKYPFPFLTMRLLNRLRKKMEREKEELDRYLYYMIVYREALGLTSHEDLYRVYNLLDDREERAP